MKKLFAIFSLLVTVLSAFAEINVNVDADGVVHVWGCAGFDEYFVISNSLGNCTNCVQISPDQMHAYKTNILASCDAAYDELNIINSGLQDIAVRCMYTIADIQSFRRFGDTPVGNVTVTSSAWHSFTSYVYTVNNTQTTLDRQHASSTGNNSVTSSKWSAYNNGIYDYANTYILPEVQQNYDQSIMLMDNVLSAQSSIRSISDTVDVMSEEACQGCSGVSGGGDTGGGGGDSSSCGNCPCVEQLDAIKDYVDHIDDDFHKQLFQMSVVTNFVRSMDSYAKLVSGILYNDATIVVDDGENSWSNVYHRGYSDLYDYDRSNILQRIELLLFGLTPISSTTNWGEVADLNSEVVDVQQQINGVGSEISEGHHGLSEDVTTIRGKISTLFDTLNFFGSSNMSTFTLNDPFSVFDVYEVNGIEPNGIDGLESFRNLIRPCFQVFYWVSGIAFMIAFWYFVVSFMVHRVFGFLKFFNNLLT